MCIRIVFKQYEYEIYFHKQTWFFNNLNFKFKFNEIKFACFTIKRQSLVKLEKRILAVSNAETYGLNLNETT